MFDKLEPWEKLLTKDQNSGADGQNNLWSGSAPTQTITLPISIPIRQSIMISLQQSAISVVLHFHILFLIIPFIERQQQSLFCLFTSLTVTDCPVTISNGSPLPPPPACFHILSNSLSIILRNAPAMPRHANNVILNAIVM